MSHVGISSAEQAGRGDILMLERAIPIQAPRIAFDAQHGEPTPADRHIGSRVLLDQALRATKKALQFLGRLAEAGGPLS